MNPYIKISCENCKKLNNQLTDLIQAIVPVLEYDYSDLDQTLYCDAVTDIANLESVFNKIFKENYE